LLRFARNDGGVIGLPLTACLFPLGNVLFFLPWLRGRAQPGCLRESAMVSTILIVLLIIALMVGLSGRFGGYGYGFGHSGMGLIGVILVVLVVLKLLHKI
jgi:hypothetical protein